MGAISPSQFTTAYCVIFGVYGLQMLLMPDKMTTQFFKTPATPMLRFWVRGFSVTIFAICFTLYKLASFDATLAAQIAVASTAGTAVLYPFNAKFGYFDKLPVIYPKHYEPEILMAGLVAAGVLGGAGTFGATREARATARCLDSRVAYRAYFVTERLARGVDAHAPGAREPGVLLEVHGISGVER